MLANFKNIPDYCTAYFLVIVTDGVIVTFVSILLHLVVQNWLRNWNSTKFYTGNYSQGPALHNWLYQLGIWVMISLISKIIITKILLFCELPLYFAASMLLLPFRGNKGLETLVIMIIIPTIVNAIVL